MGVESVSLLTKIYSNDLHSLEEVIKVGKAYGAQAEDIYGCFYFFLSQELRTFSRRLRQFQIAFKVYCAEACQLSLSIQDNILSEHGLPASIRFDRIEVSNILDANYIGMRAVLTHWEPLLVDTGSAAIVGYFMNWPAAQRGGKASEAGHNIMQKLIGQAMERRKVRKEFIIDRAHAGSRTSLQAQHEEQHAYHGHVTQTMPVYIHSILITEIPGNLSSLAFLVSEDLDALYENSEPFLAFLKKQGLDQVLREMKLTLREAHTIVPHVRAMYQPTLIV